MGFSRLSDKMFQHQVRLYRQTKDEDADIYEQNNTWELYYEGDCCIQEPSNWNSLQDVNSSNYVAYLKEDVVNAKDTDKLDWAGFNKEFSDNEDDWHRINRQSFNYEGFGTTIYFLEIGN